MAQFTAATAFATYDGRAHILGASILAGLDGELRLHTGLVAAPFEIARAKFTRKTGNNGTLLLYIDDVPADRPGGTAAEVYGVFAGRSTAGFFVPDSGRPANLNLPSDNDLSELSATPDFNGGCHIRAGATDPLLRALVDANKLIHIEALGLPRENVTAELLFIENLTIDPALANIDSRMTLRNISARNAFGRLVTLAELRFRDQDGNWRMPRISMSFQEKRPAAAGAELP